jgi:hypothetical protein
MSIILILSNFRCIRCSPRVILASSLFVFIAAAFVIISLRPISTLYQQGLSGPQTRHTQPPPAAALCDDSHPLSLWPPISHSVWVPVSGRLDTFPEHVASPVTQSTWLPKYCFIAKTSYSDAPDITSFSIDRFLASLEMQTVTDWQLVFVDTDPSIPYNYLYDSIQEYISANDPLRISILNASHVPPNPYPLYFSDRDEARHLNMISDTWWKVDYAAYNICSPESEWLIITEATDWYHPDYLQRIEEFANSSTADIIGVDYHAPRSRWMQKFPEKSRNCHSIQKYEPATCNGLVRGKFELGSLAYRLETWRAQGISISNSSADCRYDLADWSACMLHHLRETLQWNATRLQKTLFSHAPNAWQCLLYGGQILHQPHRTDDFVCVPSRENANLISQENLIDIELPHGICYHAERYGADASIDPFSDGLYFYNSSGRFSR